MNEIFIHISAKSLSTLTQHIHGCIVEIQNFVNCLRFPKIFHELLWHRMSPENIVHTPLILQLRVVKLLLVLMKPGFKRSELSSLVAEHVLMCICLERFWVEVVRSVHCVASHLAHEVLSRVPLGDGGHSFNQIYVVARKIESDVCLHELFEAIFASSFGVLIKYRPQIDPVASSLVFLLSGIELLKFNIILFLFAIIIEHFIVRIEDIWMNNSLGRVISFLSCIGFSLVVFTRIFLVLVFPCSVSFSIFDHGVNRVHNFKHQPVVEVWNGYLVFPPTTARAVYATCVFPKSKD